MKRFGLVIALVWVVLINAILLGGVFWNRSAPPEATLMLTERELSMKSMDRENTGLFLKLNWFMPLFENIGKVDPKDIWLNQSKLEELGFNTNFPIEQPKASQFYSRQLPRQVYIVLEYDGPAWEQWGKRVRKEIQSLKQKVDTESDPDKIKTYKNTMQRLKNGLIARSRLIAVDAGLDAKQLRKKYPETSKYLISPGIVRITVHFITLNDEIPKTQSRRILKGHIQEILIDEIHVPFKKRKFFKNFKKHRGFGGNYFPENTPKDKLQPRYQVTLNYGRRYEPWIQNTVAIKQDP